jgi:hypothetical protein
MRRPLIALTCLLALASVGCQKQTIAEREQKTESQICSQLASVGKALEQVAALTPTSTVGDATAADRALATALTSLQGSKQQLEKLRLENFNTQLTAFKAEVAKVASNKKQTLEQAAVGLKAKAQPVITARRQLSAAVKCAPEPAAATSPAQP